MKIRYKLFSVFLIVTAIPLFFAGVLVFYNAKNYLANSIIRNLQQLSDLKTLQIENFFDSLKSDLEIAQGYFNVKKNLPVVSRLLKDKSSSEYIASKEQLDEQLKVLQKVKGFSYVMLADASGKIVYCSNPTHEKHVVGGFLNDLNPGTFEAAKKEIYFSDPYKVTKEFLGYEIGMMAAAPIYGLDDKWAGEIVFGIDMKPLYDLIQSGFGFGESGETVVGKKINDREILVINPLRYEKDAALNKILPIDSICSFALCEATGGKENSGITVDYRGVEVLSSWHPIRYLNWGIESKVDLKEALAPVNSLRNIIFLVGIVEFLAVMFVILAASKSISDPIEELRKGAEIIAGGNLSHKVGTTAKDEIGELSRAFDKMLAQLNESQSRYIELIESTPLCIKVFDSNGKLLFLNKGGREEHFLKADDDISKWNWLDTIKEQYRPLVEKKFERALKGEASAMEFEHSKKGSKNEWCSSVFSPIKDESGNVKSIMVYSADVSGLKRAELYLEERIRERTEELSKSEERYRSLIELSPDAIVVHFRGKILFANKATSKLLGIRSVDDIIGRATLDFVHPDSRDVVKKRIAKMIETGESVPMIDEKFLRQDGSVIDVAVIATPITYQGKQAIQVIIHDITERKIIENTLRETNLDLQKFKMAVEAASDHVILTDQDGTIIYANKAAENLTGYWREEMIGNKPSLWGKQMPSKFYKEMWKIIKEDKKPFSGELKNRRKNGEIYEAEIHISPVLDESGAVEYFVGVERDVTKARQIEKAKSEFVSIASHQLRTPLTAIKWVIERFLKTETLTGKSREYLEDIYVSVGRLSAIMDDLMNLSRIEAGVNIGVLPASFDLVDFINSSLKEWEPLFVKKALTHDFSDHPSELKIETDRNIFGSIFQCLISNAIEYTPEKGGIKVFLIPEKKKEAFLLVVKDTGIGIPKSEQANIFQKFSRASNAKLVKPSGTGLGLYVANELVKLLGGEIWFESEENKGAAFYVQFPIKYSPK